jgi:hypothetical protein
VDYVDFELKIGTAVDGLYRVSVKGEAGACETDVAIAIPPEIALLAESAFAIGAARAVPAEPIVAGGPSRAIVRKHPPGAAVATAKRFGSSLFESVLTPEASAIYFGSVSMASRQSKGLRVRLRIEPPELSGIPWEFLFSPRDRRFVGLSANTPITRHLQVWQPAKPLTIEPPLRILGMIASPSDLETLNVASERATMQAALETHIANGTIELQWVDGQRWPDLQRALLPSAGPWHVFHFIGHGGFDSDSGEGIVALVDDDGTTRRVHASALANALGDHMSLRLVVLNSCEGARASDTDSFSSTGAAIVNRGIPAVVSMQYAISDAAALEFSRMFYDCLAEPLPVDKSVSEARKAIDGRWSSVTIEWGTPVLHLRAQDGHLFELDRSKTVFGEGGPVPRADTMPRFSSQMPTPGRPPGRHVASEARRGLEILRQKVRASWIKGVLERDERYTSLVELGMEEIGGLVDRDGQARTEERITEVASAATIRDVYRERKGFLLVLGEPGSGKTTAVLTIARELLDRADASPTAPIPVIFSLSSWGSKRQPLQDWMVSELAAKYAIPAKVGRTWFEVDRLIPFLDGLDEVDGSVRADCVDAINRFQEETQLEAMVVACRNREYVELPVRLTLNAAIRLKRLTLDQVAGILEADGASLEALDRVLHEDSGLLIEARSPLMLRIMIEAYRGLRVDDVVHHPAESLAARRNRIIDAYVQRKLGLRAGETR